jgi:hypothetical protein
MNPAVTHMATWKLPRSAPKDQEKLSLTPDLAAAE